MVGTGLGFVVSGALSASFGWRVGFWWLALPSIALAMVMWRQVEPDRGGQSRLSPGQQQVPHAKDGRDRPDRAAGTAQRAVAQEGIEPYPGQVLSEDPRTSSLWRAIRQVLRVRTNVVIIAASALGYFYFGGVRTFAILFTRGHFGVSKLGASLLVLVVGIGALVGVFVGGRLADHLLRRGVVNARVMVPAVALFAIPAFLAPGFWSTQLWISIPLLTIGTAFLGAANPPQDAARLDIIHPHLWGRSEGVRSALRQLFEAAAPLTFGMVSDRAFGSRVSVGDASSGAVTATQGHALSLTFVLFLGVLLLAGAIVLIALRTYPRDVATAAASRDEVNRRRSRTVRS
jgi:MFS family permease